MKQVPASIGIFGASGHIGEPMARWLRYHSPQTRLRLFSSSAAKVAQLSAQFPDCEVMVGDYFDQQSLDAAVDGMEALFVLTTTFTDEEQAMNNLVAAIRRSGSLIHMIRVVGEIPNANLRRVTKPLAEFGLGIELQHPIARKVLDESDLPVTYFNIGASFMSNFLKPMLYSRAACTLTWPDRPVPYIDPRDVAEAAARILLSDDQRHIYQFHTLNNGYDNLRMQEIVDMMGGIFGRKIGFDGSKAGYLAIFGEAASLGKIPKALPEYLWDYIAYEEENSVCWSLNDFVERTLGRRPTTMYSWLLEHRAAIGVHLGLTEASPLPSAPAGPFAPVQA